MAKIYNYGLSELQQCSDLSDIAHLLGVKPKFLSKSIYKTPGENKYQAFKIKKKNGTAREILAPNPDLKFMQSRLSRLLYQCYFDIYGSPKNPTRVLSHGFQKKRDLSIYTNACRHTSRRFVFNTDLEDFFPSFNFGRVRGFFLKHNKFKLGEKAATTLSQLACFENSLPQGAPSSPIISEFLAQPLDIALQRLAKDHRCTYSRYVDDISFSTNLREFPSEIAFSFPIPEKWTVGPKLEHEINRCGFKINTSKTRMQARTHWQSVTNLTVNEGVNIKKHYYKGARFCAHAMMTNGKAHAGNKLNIAYDELSSDQIWGKLRHICDIKDRSGAVQPLRNYNGSNPAPHYLRLSGDYFHYHRIHISPKPLVICEGKTDYTYLKEAILWHKGDARVAANLVDISRFPEKWKKVKGDHWGVDFVKHSKSADRFLDISGGGGNLVKFCRLHIERTKKFHSVTGQSPVIVIVDNDKQSEGMWSFVKEETNSSTKVDGSKSYYKVSNNLYVVPIPKPKGIAGDFYIEMLFPDVWLKHKIDGRELKIKQKKGEKLKPSEYGKGEFADKVIRANRGSVDCSAFAPLLGTLCDIVDGTAT
ncbi:retron Ec67 family RNA-directed DNA polymerase/endonuclease [Paracoccus versutus]|uniref:retron Ec67 family RNA-directed DNA polymerase/endonuclease n=1 Tax=Paracoccus versutus TaxID=34007 RepID=UPI001FB7C8FF|nr:retron Ec67 family RNA-directed DNA polymerase/endonuclease [Paracoccus versutus]MCJ1901629.1 retron Ec67 family RNA-directed DNA polymerase/endonuclease [Paracoccus versutus]